MPKPYPKGEFMFHNHSGHHPKPPRPYADVSGQGGFWSNMSYQNNNFYEDLPLGFEELQANEYFDELETPGYMEDLDYSSMDYPSFSEVYDEEGDYFGGMSPSNQMGSTFSNQGYSDFGMPGGGGYESNYNQPYMPPQMGSYQGPPSWMSGFYNSANYTPPKNSGRDGSLVQNVIKNSMQNESAPSMGGEVSPFFQAPNPTPNPSSGDSSQPQATGGPVLNTNSPFSSLRNLSMDDIGFGGIPISQMGASYNKD